MQIFYQQCVVIADPALMKRVLQTNIKNYIKDVEFAYKPFMARGHLDSPHQSRTRRHKAGPAAGRQRHQISTTPPSNRPFPPLRPLPSPPLPSLFS